ncbi:MAG: hypothetical protein J5950_02130, partial [Clostridia bacterium]|nr:hypothetical protein [Clostridia bacterium]
MRSLIVTRTKNMQGCLNDVVLYIEDNVNGRIVIQGVNCRKLGVVKNGETVRFSVDDAAARLFGAVWSAPLDCCDFIELPFGNWPVYVSGSVSSAGNSAVFLFDSSRNKGSVESVVKEKSTRTFALVFLVTLSLIALLSVFSAVQGIAHVGVAVFVWIAAIVGWACFIKWDKGNKRKKSSAEPARSEPVAASPVLP